MYLLIIYPLAPSVIRVSPNVIAIDLIAGEPQGSATFSRDVLLSPPMMFDCLGECIPTSCPDAYPSNMTRTR